MGADLSPEKDKSVSIATIFRINISKAAHFCLDTHVAGKKIQETSCIETQFNASLKHLNTKGLVEYCQKYNSDNSLFLSMPLH